MADGDAEAQNLLELEFDGALDFDNLVVQVLVVRDRGGELAGLRETWPEQTGDLLDESL